MSQIRVFAPDIQDSGTVRVSLAARRELSAERVRSGAAFLGGDAAPEPRFRAPISPSKLEAHLVSLAEGLLAARRASRFPRSAPKTCHAIGCGYFTLCHPAKEKRQLALFR